MSYDIAGVNVNTQDTERESFLLISWSPDFVNMYYVASISYQSDKTDQTSLKNSKIAPTAVYLFLLRNATNIII